MPSTPLSADQRALLSSVGVAELPQPIPAGLLTLPIFRAAVKRGELGANGMLAEAAWKARVVVAEPAARYSYYEITGDPKLGLPYGGDADILLAIAALADRADDEGRSHVDPTTGEFRAPSLRMLSRVLDLDMTKERAERIKGALERLSAVRIKAARLRQLEDIQGRDDPVALPAGNAQPIWLDSGRNEASHAITSGANGGKVRRRTRVPKEVTEALPGGDWVPEAEGTEFLITYAWRTEYHRTPRGEDWISKLQINPALLAQADRGWVGWIDCPTHARLTRPIAKRLYQLTANAQARQAPLRFELAALRQLCGIAGGGVRSAHLRDDVLAAAQELVEHDVLGSAEVTSVARGRYVFHFEPGLRLRVAGWLRGVGTPDFTEQRVLRLLLASLDVAPRIAERLVTESAGQVRQMLGYVFFQRERGHPVRAPGRYVIDGVEAAWSYEANEDFQRWMRARVTAARAVPRLDRDSHSTPPATVSTREASAVVDVRKVPRAETAVVGELSPAPQAEEPLVKLPEVSAEVRGWWEAAAGAVASNLHGLARAYLARARPALATGATLIVVASSDGEGVRLAREASVLAAALSQASEGALCEVLVLSPQQWHARAADVAVDEPSR